MIEEKDLKQAKQTFKTLCRMMDEKDWHYEKDEEKLSIECGAQGDDLPIELRIKVDPELMLIVLYSQMPFSIPEDRRTALAVAVSAANYSLTDGNFDYDFTNGRIVYRWTSCYRESLIGEELFDFMLMYSCFVIDRYNDKFLMVAKNTMSNEEIVDFIG